MARLIWAPRARGELRDIRRYIAQGSTRYAQIVVRRIVAAAERLLIFPDSGRYVPEDVHRQLREVFVHDYRVIYRYDGDNIEIMSIRHGARLLTDLTELG